MERLWGSSAPTTSQASGLSRSGGSSGPVLHARDDKSAEPAGSRFSRFMQLPSRLDLTSDELRKEGGPRRTVSGRSLAGAHGGESRSFASLDAWGGRSEDGEQSDGDGVEPRAPAPGSRFPASRSNTALAAAAIHAGEARAAASQARAAATSRQLVEPTLANWVERVWKRMC